ncbi:MAG TPA: LamG domain-containing protein [Fimbriimonadaceae bacterium]|nr:LamG domain-containing protein [Fimbriimonadaceae bacterium]
MRGLFAFAILCLGASIPAQNFALHYNGLQESVIPDCPALDISGEITIECWVKPDDQFPERMFRFLVSHHGGTDGYFLLLNRDHLVKAADVGGVTTVHIPTGKWSHIAYARSDKLAKLYVNGKLAFTQPVSGGIRPFTDHQLCIGCSSFMGDPGNQLTHFSGDLDEVRIWNRALNRYQIRASMRRMLRGNERGLIVYLPLDEGKGDMAFNKTGKTPPLRLGRSYRPDEWDPTWTAGVRFSHRK